MKKIWLFILGLCTIFFAGNFTQAKDYEYTNLDITANILIDGTIDIKEDFTANFFVQKHGIIRDIPLNYSVGGKDFHIEISNINVQGKTFTTSQSNGEWHVKIGDANRTVIGKQNYPISYSTYGLIRNFSGMGYAELYWNLVGYKFDTNINKVIAELLLPKAYTGFTKDNFLITTDGKSKTIDGFEGTVDWSKGDRIIITYDKGLPARQGITLAIKFPNNYFEFDHERQAELTENNMEKSYYPSKNQYNENKNNSIIQFKRDLKLLIISIIGLIIFFGFKSKIFYKIRIFYGISKNPLVVQYYPPEGISPSEMSLLYNMKITPSCISSMIYKWACEKRITIKNERKDFLFFHSNKIKITKGENAYTKEQSTFVNKIPTYEKQCRNYLFDDGLDEKILPDTNFSKDIVEINKEIKKYCEDKNLIKKNKVLTILFRVLFGLSIPILWPFGPLIIGMFLAYNFETVTLLIKFITNGTIINPYGNIDRHIFDGGPQTCILIILFIWLAMYIFTALSKLKNYTGSYEKLNITDEGKKILSKIYGYKKFIESCEELQLRKFIEENPDYINEILPYAAALGLETKLMKAIIPIFEEKGYNFCWYDGDLSTFTKTMNNISSSSHEYHQSSSGGSYSSDSGFDSGSSFDSGGSSFDSGGGGGGGGGSSW